MMSLMGETSLILVWKSNRAHFFLVIFRNFVNIQETEGTEATNSIIDIRLVLALFLMSFVLRGKSGLSLQIIFCLENVY